MKHFAKLLALLLCIVSGTAFAQTPVYQSGSITAGNPVMWTANRFIGDATALGGYTSLLVTSTTPTSCINDAVTTGAYHQLCFGALNLAGTGGTLLYSANGGASALPFIVAVNGGTASFNGSALTMGVAGSSAGSYLVAGSTSGTITIKTAAAAGTYNLVLPITAGSSGQVMASGGGGSTAMTWDSVSGNTTTLATVTGSGGTNNNCVAWDGSGNIKDTGSSCASSGVNAGTAGQVTYYATSSSTVSGNADLTMSSAALSVGRAAVSQGSITLNGAGGGSGGVTLTGAATITSYTVTLPGAVPSSGQTLVASGGSGTMTWGSPAPICCTNQTTNFNASVNVWYTVDTTSGAVTLTLPAAPSAGDKVQWSDSKSKFGTNNLVIARNGKNIMTLGENMTVSRNNANAGLVWDNTNSTWVLY